MAQGSPPRSVGMDVSIFIFVVGVVKSFVMVLKFFLQHR